MENIQYKEITINENTWAETYDIIRDEEDGFKVFEPNGLDFEFVKENQNKVWTYIDSDSLPYPVIVSGLHFVNRIHYFVGRKEIPSNTYIDVIEENNYPVKGAKVWWNNPDNKNCSGLYTVIEIKNLGENHQVSSATSNKNLEYYVLKNDRGSIIELSRPEITIFDDDGYCHGCNTQCYLTEPCEYLLA